MKKMTRGILIILAILLMLVACYVLYLHSHPNLNRFLTVANYRHELLRNIEQYRRNPLILVVIEILIVFLTAIPFLPVSVVCIAVGLGYGGLQGALINSIGISIGNLLVLAGIKYTGLARRIQNRHAPLMDEVAKMRQPLIGITASYAIPMVPSLLVNLTATRFKYSLRQMLIPVVVGSIPVSIIYAFGGQLFSIGDVRVDAGVIFVFAVMLLTVALAKHFRDK
ncbi:TVP38/TMEM64 family protein [Secundilactobacillus folii]|uniref:VTT domain-containing protein n=1 Tax=Secundilactobacillus folii TaxID=2678357 RepID=A0A7X2XTY5_9LACO|nr:VTT domain-containing protein [Secundilactobacillus folii]MTV81551.1 hypothetical protein [Secundilactobacillus folii]